MLNKSQAVFLAIPNSENKRILHEGRILELDGRRTTIEFDDALAPDAGGEVTLFTEVKNKFFQQGATVTSISAAGTKTTVGFETIGEPVAADQRGSYRTSVVTWNVHVRIDKNVGCLLADVSPEGVGVISPTPLKVGTTVQFGLEYEGIKTSGPLKVQGAKLLPSGKLRFGLLAPDRTSPIRQQLQKLASMAQRYQLKRLSGAA